MKRRELKKSINNLCGELFAECIALNRYENVDKDRVANVMESILMMQADIVSRISHTQPGAYKIFFKKLREDLIARTEEIIDDIQALA
ncbi:MAG: hypothetical protein IIV13_07585 [Bacteroidaceae bacterium]|nr:hypothetical protein [Bacteroidaceae bacterium]